jgi:hypothetical protein
VAVPNLLSQSSSRRAILRTGARVAYATPVVLASVRAVPAFADCAGGPVATSDCSLDRVETVTNTQVNNLGLGLSLSTGGTPPTIADINQALSGVTTYLTDFNDLAQAVANTGVGFAAALPASITITPVSGPYGGTDLPFSSPIFPSSLSGLPSGVSLPAGALVDASTLGTTTITTVGQAYAYMNLLVGGLVHALNNLQTNPASAALQEDVNTLWHILFTSPPPRGFPITGVQQAIETQLQGIVSFG